MYYKQVNQHFLDAALAMDLTLKDEVWIHDYQLMLLPQLVRQHNDQLSIGYFQHIPFPADEIFRSIPWRDELLEGLLGADLIAFHTYNDSQHFLSACVNILGLSNNNNKVDVRDRNAYIEVFPMGIDFDKFYKLAQDPAVTEKAESLKEHFQQRKIILSIDRLDYSKGIIQRLEAIEQLLQSYPELQEKFVLYMLVVPSRDTVPQYKSLLDEIDRMVGHINSVYGSNEWTPITYFYQSLPIEDLTALYVAADICLVTSLRDGMNLVCKEFIACKAPSLNGVLILSELAGAAKELTEAVQINPNAIHDMAQAIHLAMYMPLDEQKKRMKKNVEIVRKFNIHHWVRIFFSRLREIKTIQKKRITRKINDDIKQKFIKQYKRYHKRLFFLDYDGTLVGFHKDADAAVPTEELYQLLDDIQSHPDNQVVIISGRPHTILEKWFGSKPYFIVAEHGMWTNYPDHDWHNKHNISTQWKVPIKRIMQKFVNLTPGASLEEKSSSLAWHYRRVQSGLGQMRAEELAENMRYLLSQYELQMLMGDKVIEIKSNKLNKGIAAVAITEHYKPDFIFAIGDDATDEDMFYELPHTALTVKVGNKNSAARYFVDDQKEAVALISVFSNQRSDAE
jgi:trehalose 6-phosphate synthase/phosphatase